MRTPPWLRTDRGQKRVLMGILALGFLLRAYVAFFTRLPHMHKDSFEYFHHAEALLAGGYINYFPNGYPFIIALLKLITGNGVVTALLWMNILMSVAVIFFVSDIGKRLFPGTFIGLLAAFIVAVFPTQINFARWLLTEAPTAFFLVGAYFFYFREKKWLSGLFFGLATVVRTDEAPVFLLLILAAMIWRRKFEIRLLAAAMLPILLLGYYCYLKTGQFSIAGHGRVNIMFSITACGPDIDYYYQDKHPEITTTGQALGLYFRHMRSEPVEFMKQRLANLWELWGFYPSSSDGNRGWLSRVVIGLGNAFMVIFGIYAWWKNRKEFPIFVMIFPFVIVAVMHSMLLAIPRYTYPVEPFMILLGAWTIYRKILLY